MPLYEYTCRSCGEKFEMLQRMGAGSAGVVCPRCGSDEVAKQFSTFASAGSASSLPCGAPSASSCGSGGFT
jgi:putative FmdB family regulatory protein